MLNWVTRVTQKFEDRAIGSNMIYRLLQRYYKAPVENELVLGNITSRDHVLCIGGGICPLSAILFSQATGAKVTVIDNNPHCIPKAKKIIQRVGLSDRVQVLHQDGADTDIDFSPYTVVHLALQVAPLDRVLATVEKNIAPGTRLLVRRPKTRLKGMYCKLSQRLLSGCPYTSHSLCNIGTTLLYVKEDVKEAEKEVA